MVQDQGFRRVVSASRRVDMVAGYPEELARILWERFDPHLTHTVVLWTKDARNLLTHSLLRDVLNRYSQIYLHFSVTGMGGTLLEEGVPSTGAALEMLPLLANAAGSPRRLRVRFDPIVHLRLPSGEEYSNLPFFERVARECANVGVPIITVSWMALYPKVLKRLRSYGIEPIPLEPDQWWEEAALITEIAERCGIELEGCCVLDWRPGRCISGALLTQLHPLGWGASSVKAKGQRRLCGCTESMDIGSYITCAHGCVYCYANPKQFSKGSLHDVVLPRQEIERAVWAFSVDSDGLT